MKSQRTPSQRRAAQRLARLGRSLMPRASGRENAPPREAVSAPRPPRALNGAKFAALFDGFGPSAAGWEAALPSFDMPTPGWLAVQVPGASLEFPRVGPGSQQ